MVVVEYLYEDMKKLVDLPLEKVINGLSDLGAPSEYEPETKKIITELTPNRPDWYSMEGLSRALKSYYFNKHQRYTTQKSEYVVNIDESVSGVRPYTACAIAKGLRLSDEKVKDIVLLQEKLMGTLGRKVKKFGIGFYPLDAITFPIQYTTRKPEEIIYIPLGHTQEMNANEILKNHKKGQQNGHFISKYPKYPVFIDAKNKVMCLIPIVNSAETGKINETTTEIFVEVTGVDFESCMVALNIIACTLSDMGGQIYQVKVKYGRKIVATPNLGYKKRKINIKKINRILGTEMKEHELHDLLSKMDYEYNKGTIIIPPYRADIMDDVDIIEDIAIAYGYNNFKPTIPDFFSAGKVNRKFEQIEEMMQGMGFLEIKTFVLTNRKTVSLIGSLEKQTEITNPSTEDFTVVRSNLLVSMLEVFSTNKMKGLPQKFYEIGEVQIGEKTKRNLIFASMDKKVRFSDMRGYIQTLMQDMGRKLELRKSELEGFEAQESCTVMIDGVDAGRFGNIKKETLAKIGIEFEVFVCEINIETMIK